MTQTFQMPMTLAWRHKTLRNQNGRQNRQMSPAMEGQCYVKEKYPLLGLCYTDLPCSRVVALCFCYPFGDCPTLGSWEKSLIGTDGLECFSTLNMINVKQAVLNGTVGCPVKIPMDDRECSQVML